MRTRGLAVVVAACAAVAATASPVAARADGGADPVPAGAPPAPEGGGPAGAPPPPAPPPDSPLARAEAMAREIPALYGAGRSEEAMAKCREALALLEAEVGEHLTTADVTEMLGALLHNGGKPAEALPYLERAVDMGRRLRGGDHPRLLGMLANQAATLEALERHADALACREEALAMARRLYPEVHAATAQAARAVGISLRQLGRVEEAVAVLEESLAMERRLPPGDGARLADTLNSLGATLFEAGRAADAVVRLEEALSLRRRLYPGDHPRIVVALANLGGACNMAGRPADALIWFDEALEMDRRLGEGRRGANLSLLNNTAVAYTMLGRHAEALALHEEILGRRRAGGGDTAELAVSMGNVASGLLRLGRGEEALALAAEAVALRRRLSPGDHPATADLLHDLGVLRFELGLHAEAREAFEEVVAMCRRLFGGDHPKTAAALSDLAWSLHGLGREEEAEAVFRESATMALRVNWDRGYLAFAPLGATLAARGRPAEGVPWLARAIEGMEARRAAARTLGPQDRIRYTEEIRRWDAYPPMVRSQLNLGAAAAALEYSERGRGRGMLDLLEQGRADPRVEAEARARRAGDERALAALAAAREAVRAAEAEVHARERDEDAARVAARAAAGSGAAPEAAARRVLNAGAAASAARKALEEARARENRLVADALPETRPATLANMRALLGAGERLVVYDVDEGNGWALVLRPEGEGAPKVDGAIVDPSGAVAAFPLRDGGEPLKASRLDALVRPVVASLAVPGRFDAAALRALHAALAPPPLWAEIRGAPVVYVVGQGALHALPLEALVVGERDGKPVHWLDEGPPVAYAASGGVLAWLRGLRARQDARPAAPPALVAVGDPAFGGATAARPAAKPRAGAFRGVGDRLRALTLLPGTRTEVASIARAFAAAKGSATALLGAEATEARLQEAVAAGPAFLHLATHGVADETGTGALSFLALTPPANPVPGDDGALTLADLLGRWGRKLEHTRLVVLSACDTQKGALRRHEGVVALPWGFHFAGCPTVVATLWPVSDETTPRLMEEFYRRLLAGEGTLSALVAAKRALRATHPDPAYWGAFVLLGEPR